MSPLLFTPLTLRELTLRNRIVVPPMHQYSGVDGYPTDWHLVNAGKFACGGAGLVILESTKTAFDQTFEKGRWPGAGPQRGKITQCTSHVSSSPARSASLMGPASACASRSCSSPLHRRPARSRAA